LHATWFPRENLRHRAEKKQALASAGPSRVPTPIEHNIEFWGDDSVEIAMPWVVGPPA